MFFGVFKGNLPIKIKIEESQNSEILEALAKTNHAFICNSFAARLPSKFFWVLKATYNSKFTLSDLKAFKFLRL